VLSSFAKTIQEQQAAILEVDSLNFVLSALEKTDGVTIVSNPKIIVTSGYTNAVFRVGRREPIIKQELSRGTADSPGDKITANLDTSINTDSIEGGFVRTGIELKVIPTVKTDKLIEAMIDPRLTRKIGEKSVAGNSWPIIAVKEIMTKFTLRSGQTVAIGGLTDSSDEKRVTRIPLLGRIPLVGKYLFSHSEDVKTQVETIIFVSLSLAEPENMRKHDGIPETAVLVYPQMRKQRAKIEAVRRELESQEEADAAKREADAERVKAMLKKDSE
jgi:type II secretory pathway component GspD/PulD (secretin)